MACCSDCEKSGGSCGGSAAPNKIPMQTDGAGGMLAQSNGSGGDGPYSMRAAYSALGKDPGTTTTTTTSTGSSWLTIALSVAAGAVIGVGALALYQRYYENPAHDEFVGRRAQFGRFRGTVIQAEGGHVVLRSASGRLVRAPKSRISLL